MGRIDEDRLKGEVGVEERLRVFYLNQFRFGTIAVVTNLVDVEACEVYGFLKSRVEIEQMYDSLMNVLHADRMYVWDDFQVVGWMFVNFVALLFYCELRNLLVRCGLLLRFSVLDVLVALSRICMVRLDGGWVVSEVPKKTMKIFEKLDKSITKNLQS